MPRRRPSGPAPLSIDLDDFELRTLLRYANNLRNEAPALRIEPMQLKRALAKILGRQALCASNESEWPEDSDDLKLSDVTRMLQAALKAMDTSEPPPPGALQQHVDALARFFALDADTAALFALFARVHLNDDVKATRGRTATREHVVHYRIHFETTITASCRQVAAHPAKLHGS